MNVDVPTGKYVVAVSGGVDSVGLLDVLAKQKNLDLIVAHFDHGIRKDSSEDKKFVEDLAKKYALPFESSNGNLGSHASEELARKARYDFLRSVKAKQNANAIITAHHQDDVIETILINLLRGTRRRGLSSLQSTNEIVRPFLSVSKNKIKSYATENNLQWREDATNQDPKYLRNWVRINLVPKLTTLQRSQLLSTNKKAGELNTELDEIIADTFDTKSEELSKASVINFSHNVASEIMANWLRNNHIRDFDAPTIERLVIGAKTLGNNKSVEIKKGAKMSVQKDVLKIIT